MKRRLLSLSLILCLASQTAVWAQEGTSSAPAYNAELAKALAEIAWTEANGKHWRHWSDSKGVEIFHDRNDGRMRDVHMRHIRGNPNAENMQVAGPGFYIASDVKSSAYFGQELLDVRLAEKARLIDITNPETVRKISELFQRHNVPYKLSTSSDLRKVELLDFLTKHGITGARYTNSSHGSNPYSWVTVWDHNALSNLRRGSSSVHVEMWKLTGEVMNTGYGSQDPVERVRNDGTLKKFEGYVTDGEIKAFSEVRKAVTGEAEGLYDRANQAARDMNIKMTAEGQAPSVRISNGEVVLNMPRNANAAQVAQGLFEAQQARSLLETNAEMAKRVYGSEAAKHAAAEYLRQNAKMRSLRMAEGLFHGDAETRAQLEQTRLKAERAATQARYEVAEWQRLRGDFKTRRNVDMPPTHMERMAEAFPKEFDLKRFHTEPKTYYEVSKQAKEAFSRNSTIKTLRDNVFGRRNLTEGLSNVREVFIVEGEGGLNSLYRTYQVGPDASPEMLQRFMDKMAKYGAVVERVAKGDPRLPKNGQARTYINAKGEITVLLPADKAVKKYALIDELTHVRQFSNMAKNSSIQEVRAVLDRAAKGDIAAKEVLVRWEIKARKNVLLTMQPNDPSRKVVEQSIRELELKRDPFIQHRRSSGRIDWKRFSKTHGAGLAHFTLALFLKELAMAIETGDAQVISEFFDGLLTTDFFLNYGLFSLGAHGGNLVYSKVMERHLNKYVRPRFVRSIIHTNVIMAAGMALPHLFMGPRDGKAFAIELAGLGLSTVAVKGSIEVIRTVFALDKLARGPRIAATLGKYAKLTNVAGWVYTAAEMAVVLYYGEKISHAINDYYERKEVDSKLNDAISKFRAQLNKPGLTEAELEAATAELSEAYVSFRNYLYEPLKSLEVELLMRLQKLNLEIQGKAAALKQYDEMAVKKPEVFGRLRAQADELRRRIDAENKEAVERIFKSYEDQREEMLKQIYRDEMRGPKLRSSSANDAWALAGGHVGASGDPMKGRSDLFARMSRWQSRRDFEKRLSSTADNRLVSYDDQAALLALAASAVKDKGQQQYLRDQADAIKQLKQRERALVLNEGPLAGQGVDKSAPVEVEVDSLGLVRALAKVRDAAMNGNADKK